MEAKCQAQPSLPPPCHDRSWWPGRSDQQPLNQRPKHFGLYVLQDCLSLIYLLFTAPLEDF